MGKGSGLVLPGRAVSDRVSITVPLEPDESREVARLDGPGCIHHIFLVIGANPRRAPTWAMSRRMLIRIAFDDSPIAHVEVPVGDFFGVMHGEDWYPIDNHYLSVKAWNGYNCYFPMPFARGARIELVNGPQACPIYLQVDWHRYPGAALEEPRRFCARWRREMPTERYGEDFLMVDADGPGDLLGFVYGVRLTDDVDRWSHGGSENIYIDGEGSEPAYLRGIGGEDTFGAGYGGALHPPESHHYAGMPYYVHADVGSARPAQRLTGYRFFEADAIHFDESLHMRFGCMSNDIASTVYWYQTRPVREFFTLPDWEGLLPGGDLPRSRTELPLPESGSWWLCGPFGNEGDRAMVQTLEPERRLSVGDTYPGNHEVGSLWLSEASGAAGVDVARWVRRPAHHGFVDVNHAFRPRGRGAAVTYPAVVVARASIVVPTSGAVRLRLAWDDDLVLWVDDRRFALGCHHAFRSETVEVSLPVGTHAVVVKLNNTKGSNHGGWAFAFQALAANGDRLEPVATVSDRGGVDER